MAAPGGCALLWHVAICARGFSIPALCFIVLQHNCEHVDQPAEQAHAVHPSLHVHVIRI